MTETKKGRGRPKGSGKQLSDGARSRESRKTRLDAGGERFEVIISKSLVDKKAAIFKARPELDANKTTLLETLLEEEWERLKG